MKTWADMLPLSLANSFTLHMEPHSDWQEEDKSLYEMVSQLPGGEAR